jgi:predicted RNA-binding Zn-ribbon protein involved in translation (DUF1610 family)
MESAMADERNGSVEQDEVVHFYHSPTGQHRHSCWSCGSVWEHSDDNRGSVQAHTCPDCGAEPSEQDLLAMFFDPAFQNWCQYEGPQAPKHRGAA